MAEAPMPAGAPMEGAPAEGGDDVGQLVENIHQGMSMLMQMAQASGSQAGVSALEQAMAAYEQAISALQGEAGGGSAPAPAQAPMPANASSNSRPYSPAG